MLRDLKRALLAAGLILALSGLAWAHGGSLDARQHGYEHGYRDGFEHGRQDRAQSAGYDFQGDDYRYADRGYDASFGDRDQFVEGYREGYRAGYDDGYNGRSGRFEDIYGHGSGYDPEGREPDHDDDQYARRGYGYRDVAYDIGYRDGVEDAQKDLREHKSTDLSQHHKLFHKADHGYNSSYGDKDAYRQRYREGYQAAYRDVFDVARVNGYRDGFEDARKDRHHHRASNPTDHGWYRHADRGYGDGYYGTREDYQQHYREGYAAGYNDGYNNQGH